MRQRYANNRIRRLRLVVETLKQHHGHCQRFSNDNPKLNDQERFDRAIEREMAGSDDEYT